MTASFFHALSLWKQPCYSTGHRNHCPVFVRTGVIEGGGFWQGSIVKEGSLFPGYPICSTANMGNHPEVFPLAGFPPATYAM